MHKSGFINKRFKRAFLCILFIPGILLAQVRPVQETLLSVQSSFERGELDVRSAALQQLELLERPVSNTHAINKCLTPATMFLHQHRDELDSDILAKAQSLGLVESQNSTMAEESYISPSGKFEIIYQTSGPDSVSITDDDGNGVPDYIDHVAEAADSSYRHEVLTIGFTDPIPPGQTYKVRVEDDLSGGAYGLTNTSSTSPGGTFIVIESNFDGFPENTHPDGDQIGAIYVTMAHEFKHAIQYAQNNWSSPSGAFNWSEMDATLMEEVVYDDVNDYYNYIKNGINSDNPNSSSIFFSPGSGTPGAYWHVSWMIYYYEKFGSTVWHEVWQEIESENNLSIDDALRRILPAQEEDFSESFVQNHLWHLASGSRTGTDSYGFREKEEYPNSNLEATFNSVPESSVNLNSVSRMAARYYEVIPSPGDMGTIEVAVDFDTTQVGVGLLFYHKDGRMTDLIATGENKAQLFVPSQVNWADIDRLGLVIANYSNALTTRDLSIQFGKTGQVVDIRDPEYGDIPEQIAVFQNYPNPFNPSTKISFELPQSAFVNLEVFDIMGRKVQTLANETLNPRSRPYEYTFNAEGLSSGMYIYRLRIDGEVFTKKMMYIK
ncbi:MXAN_6640 family putative metalloprotease [Gracilimonas amylolytica]|uniref:MXAN_6640 family putative metalloprotease n=1 Tax=Gracilimonas amylolytica TaxID=1749045 RepID=UPI000CD86CA5|nr:MXAN_6640 family putative metalloprotease [Gracilimonas amylolytica]